MLDMAMVAQCSPNMNPVIVQAIVKTESSFNPFAIGVNNGKHLAQQPSSFGEAVKTAKRLIAQGTNIDMGLGQINSANMSWLNLSVEQAFSPCSNLQALQRVYLTCYDKAGNSGLGNRMQRAFSCYNTGNTTKGFYNGYVTKTTNNFNSLITMLPSKQTVPSYIKNQPQSVYTVKNGSIVTVEPQQTNLTTNLPFQAQNTNMGVPVQSDDANLTQPQNPEIVQADNTPVKVYHSWDVFRDF
jgi:virB1-like protein